MNRRHLILGAALALTLLAVWQVNGQEPAAGEKLAMAAVASPAHAPSASAPLPPQERMSESEADLFAAKDWNPPPPVPAAPAKPAKPEPPPLPYRYLGRWEEKGVLTLILGRDGQSIPIHEGQTLDGQWRVDHVAANRVDFTFLPLNTHDHLTMEIPQ